jgi:hypothetical protein
MFPQDNNALAVQNQYPHEILIVDHHVHGIACAVGDSHGPQEFQSFEPQAERKIALKVCGSF